MLAYERHLTGSGVVNRAKPSTIVKPRKSIDGIERTVISPTTFATTVTTISDSRVSSVGKTSSLRSVRLKPEKSSYESAGSTTNPPRDKENIPVVSEQSRTLPEVIDLASDESPAKVI